MTKWHELEAVMPESAKDEIQKLTGERPLGFWILDLVGTVEGGARYYALTIKEQEWQGETFYSAMIWDEISDKEIARYAGNEEQVMGLVTETIAFYKPLGIVPTAGPEEAWL